MNPKEIVDALVKVFGDVAYKALITSTRKKEGRSGEIIVLRDFLHLDWYQKWLLSTFFSDAKRMMKFKYYYKKVAGLLERFVSNPEDNHIHMERLIETITEIELFSFFELNNFPFSPNNDLTGPEGTAHIAGKVIEVEAKTVNIYKNDLFQDTDRILPHVSLGSSKLISEVPQRGNIYKGNIGGTSEPASAQQANVAMLDKKWNHDVQKTYHAAIKSNLIEACKQIGQEPGIVWIKTISLQRLGAEVFQGIAKGLASNGKIMIVHSQHHVNGLQLTFKLSLLGRQVLSAQEVRDFLGTLLSNYPGEKIIEVSGASLGVPN